MYRRLRDYALALAVIVAAYGVYALTVVQWLEPHSAERTGIAGDPPPPPPDLPNPFEHLFQPGDWELNSPKVLLTSQPLSGATTNASTPWVWQVRVQRSCPTRVSQIRTVPSRWSPVEASQRPSGATTNDVTGPVWLVRT